MLAKSIAKPWSNYPSSRTHGMAPGKNQEIVYCLLIWFPIKHSIKQLKHSQQIVHGFNMPCNKHQCNQF